MAVQEITVARVLTESGWLERQVIRLNNGFIKDIAPAEPERQCSGMLVPGLIDLQVNGGGGKLLNQTPSLETIRSMVAAHRRFGTTAMLPTLITDDLNTMMASADAVAEAISDNVPEVLGIHFEGPLLAVAKKGVHPAQHIRRISDGELAQYCRKDIGVVLVTLAPENVPPDVIKDLTAQGVKVCLGHSNASYEQVMAALEAGATGFTHIFNAMSPLQSRAPGMVGAALSDKNSYAGLVLDHHHVHPAMSKLAIEVKTPERLFLVTDAMAHVGSDENEHPYFNTLIRRTQNKLTTPDGTLAGSCLDMWQAVLNAHQDLGVSLSEAIKMASLTPASYLGLTHQHGSIAPGQRADFILLNEQLRIEQVFVAGEQKYHNQGIHHDHQ